MLIKEDSYFLTIKNGITFVIQNFTYTGGPHYFRGLSAGYVPKKNSEYRNRKYQVQQSPKSKGFVPSFYRQLQKELRKPNILY